MRKDAAAAHACLPLLALAALSAACGSLSSPDRDPSIHFSQGNYADIFAANSPGQILQFQPSRTVIRRGSDLFPPTVVITRQPAAGCVGGPPLALFLTPADTQHNVSPLADSVVFTESYTLCGPFANGVFPLTATYVANGKTFTATATVTLTGQ